MRPSGLRKKEKCSVDEITEEPRSLCFGQLASSQESTKSLRRVNMHRIKKTFFACEVREMLAHGKTQGKSQRGGLMMRKNDRPSNLTNNLQAVVEIRVLAKTMHAVAMSTMAVPGSTWI
jgi:hypothetical protein